VEDKLGKRLLRNIHRDKIVEAIFLAFALLCYTCCSQMSTPEPAEFHVYGVDVNPAKVANFDNVTVSAVIGNSGGVTDNFTAILNVDGKERGRYTVAIKPSENVTVSFALVAMYYGPHEVEIGSVTNEFFVYIKDEPPATVDSHSVELLINQFNETSSSVINTGNFCLDPNAWLRVEIIRKFGTTKDPRVVPLLIDALAEWDGGRDVSVAADEALVDIGAPSIEPLIASLKSEDRMASDDARRIIRRIARTPGAIINTRGGDILMAALKKNDSAVIMAAYPFFIAKGEPDSETLLVEALRQSDYTERLIDGEMAVDFLNSGNSILEQAATSWAAQHHYQIVTKYGSSKHLKWGVYQ
jgi:hypothetical protein